MLPSRLAQKNENGAVVATPSNTTVAGLISALGLPGGTVIRNCDVPQRSTGVFVGPGGGGEEIFEL
jgi:hypothetical protein